MGRVLLRKNPILNRLDAEEEDEKMKKSHLSTEEMMRLVFATIDEFNKEIDGNSPLKKSLDTRLFGKQGQLDSLGLVMLIVAVEERLQNDLGIAVTLADEKAMSRNRNPFGTIGSLIDYLCEILEAHNGDRA